MNVVDRARDAYRPDNTVTRTPSAIEYEAFLRVTRKLTAANTPAATAKMIADAVYENRRLWIVIAASVADDANGLPEDLRARLFYLAEFTNHHSSRVFADKASLEPLIDVNTAIMDGLRNQSVPS